MIFQMFLFFLTELETNKAKTYSPQLKQNKASNKTSSLMLTEFLHRIFYFFFRKQHLHMFSFFEILLLVFLRNVRQVYSFFFFFNYLNSYFSYPITLYEMGNLHFSLGAMKLAQHSACNANNWKSSGESRRHINYS